MQGFPILKKRSMTSVFIGELKESQVPTVEELLQNDNGILNAAIAFGKTMVCCKMIAQRRVSTLAFIQSLALMAMVGQVDFTKFVEFMLRMIRNALKEISETHKRTNVAINVVINEEKNNSPLKARWKYVS